MEDLEGYREARAAQWERRPENFELEAFVSGLIEGSSNEQRQKIVVRTGSVCCLITMVLMSIGSLMPLQYGLTINSITRQVNTDSVYHGGRHLIGPWNSFIAFPSTVVTVSFTEGTRGNGPLATRTKDGLSLTLQLTFQYRMAPDSLGELFKLANMQYEPLFVRNARDVLLKAAADYEASEYWENREKIGVEMQDLLDKRLASVYATCVGLQLLVIELPKEFESSIVQTQVQQQMVKTKQNDQQVRRTIADTTVLEASYSRNITVTRNGADARFKQLTQIAEATANQRLLMVEARTMRLIKDRLKMSADQVIAFQQFQAYRFLDNASFVYGMGNSMLTIPAKV